MQRHRQLILKLLEFAVDQTNGDVQPPEIPGYTAQQVQYHVELCSQAGYMKVRKLGGKKARYRILSLTWQGHEALVKLREEFADD